MHIVIVDDEPKIQKRTFKTLSAHVGWEVTGALKAKEALKFLYENPVDVMITDIKMPELSGLDLISRIREANQEVDCYPQRLQQFYICPEGHQNWESAAILLNRPNPKK